MQVIRATDNAACHRFRAGLISRQNFQKTVAIEMMLATGTVQVCARFVPAQPSGQSNSLGRQFRLGVLAVMGSGRRLSQPEKRVPRQSRFVLGTKHLQTTLRARTYPGITDRAIHLNYQLNPFLLETHTSFARTKQD